MKNYWIIPVLTIVILAACKGKKDEKQEPPISAISIIKGQLNKLDSSLHAFMKLERNGNRTDTTYLKREEVKNLAAPFITLPDIADKSYFKKYDEERLIDAEQGTLSITSNLKDGENSEIQKQLLIVGLSDVSTGKVHSIYIESSKKLKDTLVEQKLFWEIDKYFTILTEKENMPEKSQFTKVVWQ